MRAVLFLSLNLILLSTSWSGDLVYHASAHGLDSEATQEQKEQHYLQQFQATIEQFCQSDRLDQSHNTIERSYVDFDKITRHPRLENTAVIMLGPPLNFIHVHSKHPFARIPFPLEDVTNPLSPAVLLTPEYQQLENANRVRIEENVQRMFPKEDYGYISSETRGASDPSVGVFEALRGIALDSHQEIRDVSPDAVYFGVEDTTKIDYNKIMKRLAKKYQVIDSHGNDPKSFPRVFTISKENGKCPILRLHGDQFALQNDLLRKLPAMASRVRRDLDRQVERERQEASVNDVTRTNSENAQESAATGSGTTDDSRNGQK